MRDKRNKRNTGGQSDPRDEEEALRTRLEQTLQQLHDAQEESCTRLIRYHAVKETLDLMHDYHRDATVENAALQRQVARLQSEVENWKSLNRVKSDDLADFLQYGYEIGQEKRIVDLCEKIRVLQVTNASLEAALRKSREVLIPEYLSENTALKAEIEELKRQNAALKLGKSRVVQLPQSTGQTSDDVLRDFDYMFGPNPMTFFSGSVPGLRHDLDGSRKVEQQPISPDLSGQ